MNIDFKNQFIFNHGILLNKGIEYNQIYQSAHPYPHIVFDNFFSKDFIDQLVSEFPVKPLVHDIHHEGGYAGHHKRQIYPGDCNAVIQQTFLLFNSAFFLQFLEKLTGIEALLPDPYFIGGGFHESFRGGRLGIHADFRINQRLHLHRRLNVLIYLNKDWQEDWGGHLEIWDQSMKARVRSIAPIFNRCLIFNTDANSYHGHPDPLNIPDYLSRKSIALYYYTASMKIYDELPTHSTMYAARPTDKGNIKQQVWYFNFLNYKNDLLPPVIRSPKLLLPPILYRQIKKLQDWRKKRKRKSS